MNALLLISTAMLWAVKGAGIAPPTVTTEPSAVSVRVAFTIDITNGRFWYRVVFLPVPYGNTLTSTMPCGMSVSIWSGSGHPGNTFTVLLVTDGWPVPFGYTNPDTWAATTSSTS
jgi:hypothetical protein